MASIDHKVGFSASNKFTKSLPEASEIRLLIEQNRINSEKKEEKKVSLREAEKLSLHEEYEEILYSLCLNAIEKMSQSSSFKHDIILPKFIGKEKTVPIHVIHYGTLEWVPGKSIWSRRIPLEIKSFRKIQTLLFEKGFYLLDESDPAKSFRMRVCIYAVKPFDYETSKRLWHRYNRMENDE
jgi:hypothetical protein